MPGGLAVFRPSWTFIHRARTTNKRVSVGMIAELDSVLPITVKKKRLVAQSIESDTSQAAVRLKRKTIGLTLQSHQALAITRRKSLATGQSVESDTSQAIAAARPRSVNQVSETDAVLGPIARKKSCLLGMTTETDVIFAVVRRKLKAIAVAAEVDFTQGMFRAKRRTLVQTLEIDLAQQYIAPSSSAVPTDLVATAVSPSEIDLTWRPVSSALGYDIERNGVIVATNVSVPSYADTGLLPSTTYTYRVRTRR